MKLDTKYKLLFIGMIAILAMQIYVTMVFEPDATIHQPYERLIEGLRKDNTMLLQSISRHEDEVRLYRTQIDSLEHLKKEKEIEYVNKYKEVDAADAPAIVAQFRSIFTANDIK